MGCALGILVSERMGKRARQASALALFSVGILSAAPYVVDYVSKRVNGPGTLRGQARRRELIRDAAIPAEEFFDLEELEEVL